MKLACVALALFVFGRVACAQCQPVWSSIGAGADWEVRALAPFDEDGSGPLPPALFAGGGFGSLAGTSGSDHIARWDGWQSSGVAAGLTASDYGTASLLAIPEPIGMLPAGLYVGGELDVASGVPVNSLARWDGGEWHDVGGGVTRPGTTIPYVFAMQVFDEDGEGPLPPALFVGGQFEHASGVATHALARWDGREWSKVGEGLGSATSVATVRAMTVYDDGRGPALYVGGKFLVAGGEEIHNVARWDGAAWKPVGPGLSNTVQALQAFDEDGPGPQRPALFAGGQFSAVWGGEKGSLMRLGRWDGSEWSEVGGWSTPGAVKAMAVWDQDGAGPAKKGLYVGGYFTRLPDGTICNQIARWDGNDWHDVGRGVTGFEPATAVNTLTAFDEDGPGPNPGGLYVGGLFYYAGGIPAQHIARWGCPLPPTPPCYADCDRSGDLTFFDFLCFQNLFTALDPTADCDGDTAHTFFDFLCFQNAFAAGCP